MNFFNEYALLVAVAVPVLAIIGLNIFLWMGGEGGTLLLPSHYERVSFPAAIETAPETVTDETPAATGIAVDAPANDEEARKAA